MSTAELPIDDPTDDAIQEEIARLLALVSHWRKVLRNRETLRELQANGPTLRTQASPANGVAATSPKPKSAADDPQPMPVAAKGAAK